MVLSQASNTQHFALSPKYTLSLFCSLSFWGYGFSKLLRKQGFSHGQLTNLKYVMKYRYCDNATVITSFHYNNFSSSSSSPSSLTSSSSSCSFLTSYSLINFPLEAKSLQFSCNDFAEFYSKNYINCNT